METSFTTPRPGWQAVDAVWGRASCACSSAWASWVRRIGAGRAARCLDPTVPSHRAARRDSRLLITNFTPAYSYAGLMFRMSRRLEDTDAVERRRAYKILYALMSRHAAVTPSLIDIFNWSRLLFNSLGRPLRRRWYAAGAIWEFTPFTNVVAQLAITAMVGRRAARVYWMFTSRDITIWPLSRLLGLLVAQQPLRYAGARRRLNCRQRDRWDNAPCPGDLPWFARLIEPVNTGVLSQFTPTAWIAFRGNSHRHCPSPSVVVRWIIWFAHYASMPFPIRFPSPQA